MLRAACLILISLFAVDPAQALAQSYRVEVIDRPAAHRVDVLVDGRPFTAYLYQSTLEKPVLFPLRTASGTIVTRGFPLEPRPGESNDHPHHIGHWFNFGDVN